MQRTLNILLFIISCQVFGQRDVKVVIDDFNNDGIIDTLKSYYEGGSGFGGRYVQIVNGKTREVYELSNDGCFCQIKQVILIPPELTQKENRLFLETIKEQLLPEKKNVPDASLNWIIKSSYNKNKLDTNQIFDLIIDPQTDWFNKKFEYPTNYYLEMEGDTLAQLYDTPYEVPDWYNKKSSKGFLVYYANNHYSRKSGDSISLSDSNALYEVFYTSHGVVVKKGDLHKWVFISDVSITGAPEKLRWESIKKVKLVDKYLIIQQALPPTSINRIFVINIETGIGGRLKYEISKSEIESVVKLDTFSIQEDSIILNVEGGQFSLSLKNLFNELERQYIENNRHN